MHGANCLFLLKEGKGKYTYLHVGEGIYSFTTKEPILYYAANVGNNDVPYPVGYSENNLYYFLESQYIPFDKVPLDHMWCYACPLCTLKNPWHADVVVQVWYHQADVCPKNFLKKKLPKPKKLAFQSLSNVKSLVPRFGDDV